MIVKLFARFRQAVGTSQIEVAVRPGDTVRNVLRQVVDRHPALGGEVFDAEGNLRQFVGVFISGRELENAERLDAHVGDGDEIALVPPIAGGG